MSDTDLRSYVTYPTWRKKTALARHVASMSVRDKRQIFTWMRDTYDSHRGHDLFMPKYGCTMGEFCTWHVLAKLVLADSE